MIHFNIYLSFRLHQLLLNSDLNIFNYIFFSLNNFAYFKSKHINNQLKYNINVPISSKTINLALLIGIVLFIIGTSSIIFYFIMGFVIEIIISALYSIIGWILFVIGGFFIIITPRKFYHKIIRNNKKPLEIELLIIGLYGMLIVIIWSMAADISIYRNEGGMFPSRTILSFTGFFIGFIMVKIIEKKKIHLLKNSGSAALMNP